MPRRLTAEIAFPARMEIGESPIWDEGAGELLWVDTMRGRIHRVEPTRRGVKSLSVGQPVGSIVLAESGAIVAAVRDGFGTIEDDGRLRMLALVEIDDPDTRMNDGHCDPLGRFWAGTMELDAAPGRGSLYRLDLDLKVHRMVTDVACSNGIGWSPDGGRMYFVDSPLRRIDAFDFDVATGALSNRRPLVGIDATDGVPDGLAVDSDGFVWVALWGGGAIHRYSPEGALDLVVAVPVAVPTSCVFGGPDLGELYITTASIASDGAELAHGAGSVFRCRPGARGFPATRFPGL